jgi:hypothetical protein
MIKRFPENIVKIDHEETVLECVCWIYLIWFETGLCLGVSLSWLRTFILNELEEITSPAE